MVAIEQKLQEDCPTRPAEHRNLVVYLLEQCFTEGEVATIREARILGEQFVSGASEQVTSAGYRALNAAMEIGGRLHIIG